MITQYANVLLFLIISLSVVSCDQPARNNDSSSIVPDFSTAEDVPGGETTVTIKPFASFMRPANNLPQSKRAAFHAGKALAHQPWIKAPTVTFARDGLGPIYNARTCLGCHQNGGRGKVPASDQKEFNQGFVRISLPGKHKKIGVLPEPIYGTQLQTQSIALSHQLRFSVDSSSAVDTEVQPEAYVFIDWHTKKFTYPDGKNVELRFPKLKIKRLSYGELHQETRFSLRNSPILQGVGLIELISQTDINAAVDPDDVNGDGISGRLNYVWDADVKKIVPGRFGLKANQPANLRTVTAVAFRDDIGISNTLFPDQPCTPAQKRCLQQVNGNDAEGVELPDNLLDLTTNFIRNIGVAARRKLSTGQSNTGRKLFYQSGCHHCHKPSFTTISSQQFPHLSNQKIWPYSDFLLHDMGKALADNRTDFEATGSEWRTPPLWGVGLNKAVNGHQFLLHDGRARSVEEAILWHGGEAKSALERYSRLPEKQRKALLAFIESL